MLIPRKDVVFQGFFVMDYPTSFILTTGKVELLCIFGCKCFPSIVCSCIVCFKICVRLLVDFSLIALQDRHARMGVLTVIVVQDCLARMGVLTFIAVQDCLARMGVLTFIAVQGCLARMGVLTVIVVQDCLARMGVLTVIVVQDCLARMGVLTIIVVQDCLARMGVLTFIAVQDCLARMGVLTVIVVQNCLARMGVLTVVGVAGNEQTMKLYLPWLGIILKIILMLPRLFICIIILSCCLLQSLFIFINNERWTTAESGTR